MARVEYFNDPHAPTANSIVVAVTTFVLDPAQRLLMIQRTDNDLWSIPGGAQEIGETIAQAATRETREETGITTKITGLVGIYSNPAHVMAYDNGEVRQQFSICLRADPVTGTPTTSDESTHVRWVPRDELPALDIHPSIRLRIEHGYAHHLQPYIG
jgi:ADP-ribose pyrophosphatase YjhB (NUDIX family)